MAIAEPGRPAPDGFIMAGLIIASALSIGLAWWREEFRGILLVLVGVALTVFALIQAGHNKGLTAIISGTPFLAVGILLLVGWWTTRDH